MWQQVLQVHLSVPFRDFVTDYEFNSPLLILSAFATSDYSDNFRIGKIRPVYNINNSLAPKSGFKTIRLQQQFIRFLELPYPYKLEFIWYVWLPQLTLTFYQPTFGDIVSLETIQGMLVEERANTAYIQSQLDRIEQSKILVQVSN